MNYKDNIFCAIDFTKIEESKKFISKISDHVGGIKIGLEFFSENGPQGVIEIKKMGLPIFLDMKLKDIPNTAKKSAKNLIKLKPDYLSVHLSGGYSMLKEIISIKETTKILGVSMLTSLDNKDLKSFGYNLSSLKYVENLAKIGEKAGVDGLVSSAHEVAYLKERLNNKKLLYITPGIRLPQNSLNDQKRVVSPSDAIKSGSSILIIGRSITQSNDPIDSINKIIKEIEVNFESKNQVVRT